MYIYINHSESNQTSESTFKTPGHLEIALLSQPHCSYPQGHVPGHLGVNGSFVEHIHNLLMQKATRQDMASRRLAR